MTAAQTMVRPAVRDDGPAIVDLLRQLGYDVQRSRWLPLLAVLMKRTEHEMLVAEHDGHTVGFINVNYRVFFRYGELVATVDELCVDEGHRSLGIGAQLLDAAVASAGRRGAHHVELTTNVRRVDALRFYERHGFEVTSHKLVYALTEQAAPGSHLKEESHAG